MSNSKVLVLLSAYNGEEFIKEQINSLLGQKDISVSILVRDDGSSDKTIEILAKYQSRGRIRLIRGGNAGVTASFLELLKNAEEGYDYYAFCDQDDVWLPDKLCRAAAVLGREDQSMPLLYTSCLNIVDRELKPVGYWPKPRRGVSFYNAMIENVCTGNTQVFNPALKELFIKAQDAPSMAMHDHFAYMLAAALGKVVFDDVSHILYRQHDKNAIGMSGGVFKNLSDKMKTVFSGKIKRISRQLAYFISVYGAQMDEACISEAKRFLCARHFISRIKYMAGKKAFYQKPFPALCFWTLYLFGFIN